jgi:anti-anti-sigma factor
MSGSDSAPQHTGDHPRYGRVAVCSHEGRAALCLSGDHDFATAPDFRAALAAATASGHTDVVVDLDDVTFMDASTLHELIQAQHRLLDRSGRFALRSPSRCARRLLELCDLTGLIEPEARRDVGPP